MSWADGCVLVQEQPDAIAKMRLPRESKQTCVDWAAFTNVEVVDEIDSGL